MTIAQAGQQESIREALNRADLNTIADLLRSGAFGDVLRGLPVYLRAVAPAAHTPQQLSTLDVIELPQDAKAAVILRATVKKSGGSTIGELTIEPYGTTPSTTQVAVAPNGDIVFDHTTDLVTSVDVIYVPQKGDVLGNCKYSKLGVTSLTLAIDATGFAKLPAPYAGQAILLMQANVTVGAVTGQKIILVPASAVVATTKAALSKDGTGVWFNLATDAPTQCVVDVLVASGLVSTGGVPGLNSPTTDINAVLEQANGGASSAIGT